MERSLEKPAAPDLDGEMEKLKHRSTIFGAWAKRYFRMNRSASRLEYFPNKSKADAGAEPSGFILLENVKSVRKFDENSIQIDAGTDGVLHLRNDSQALLQYWIDELNRFIASYREYERNMQIRGVAQRESSRK